jgi:hypothetical protein
MKVHSGALSGADADPAAPRLELFVQCGHLGQFVVQTRHVRRPEAERWARFQVWLHAGVNDGVPYDDVRICDVRVTA